MESGHICERVDKEAISSLASNLPEEDAIVRISNIFHALQSGPRLKIMYLLLEKEMFVCELEFALGMSQSAISHNLRTLRQLDLVRTKKKGRFVVYSVADEHVKMLLELSRKHVMRCAL
ncbi:transcriptional regulator, ArsR family [Methanococcoides vulcani]|uniref:Transcriptional regulator, ArsR family n=1 Tax=Methanococcoides vulcani TaxID=1353158 RepID=A0A1H9Z3Y5_9EURY|nr:metalloregulator ArsR/SmtB family transcription factor [Methanococcoides vulcani]SES76070.1 transcriptional regulator, ArsR family [Methanococcoides vulcani]